MHVCMWRKRHIYVKYNIKNYTYMCICMYVCMYILDIFQIFIICIYST